MTIRLESDVHGRVCRVAQTSHVAPAVVASLSIAMGLAAVEQALGSISQSEREGVAP